MRNSNARLAFLWVSGLTLLTFGLAVAGPPTKTVTKPVPIDFDRDVRPILADNCFSCHGFDANKRVAGLRLDTAAGAFAKLASGKQAIVPGKPEESELLKRILLPESHGLHMPPISTKKVLTTAQVGILRRWIAQGAVYKKHWAFETPVRPTVPTVKNGKWVRNSVDAFVLSRLEKEGLKPSPEADKRTLIRRLTLDLTGLPPTPQEVEAFVKDTSPNAYEKVVDRLMASPHYGERMALPWLDLSRYADTHGYHIDSLRDMYRWRDWVIDAYNANMPYDEFLTEQIAGDLLPKATLSQKIATGFNRNHPINYEGGAVPEEYAAVYVHDRVDTTSTAILGLTTRCGQCHDHKYDPISQKDYYRFFAFFNNNPENGLDGQNGNAAPFIKAPNTEQASKLTALDSQVTTLTKRLAERADAQSTGLADWEKKGASAVDALPAVSDGLVARYPLAETSGESVNSTVPGNAVGTVKGKAEWAAGKFGANTLKFDGNTYVDLGRTLDVDKEDHFSYGAWINPADNGHMTVVSRMNDATGIRGWDLFLGDNRVYVHLIHEWEKDAIRINSKQGIPANQWTHVFVTYDGSGKAKGLRLYINGNPVEQEVTHDSLQGTLQVDTPTHIGRRNPSGTFKGQIGDVRFYNRTLSPTDVALLANVEPVRAALSTIPEKRTAEQKEALGNLYLRATDPVYRLISDEKAEAQKRRNDFERGIPTVMVMQEMEKPRETHILIRGQYDKKGAVVTPGIPEIFGTLDAKEPPNRLSLAHWLTNPKNPLVSRVAVNRYWQMFFGMGLVRTPENFGTQGSPPTHPELLDWLATEYIRTKWNTKAFVRMLVTSSTYRQSSKLTPELRAKDPENILLARAPRIRLTAEFIRDQALAVSGLLVQKVGGPSVLPYHPEGLWEELSINPDGFSAQRYVQDHGEKLYHRSLYIFWKRTVPPPSMLTFDAPEREFCIVRRPATNTPLQALILMNDPTYTEASRKFAERILKEPAKTTTDRQRIDWAFRIVLSRPANEREAKTLLNLLNAERAIYRKDHHAAHALLKVGEFPRDTTLNAEEAAAWTIVSTVLLNIDQTVTRE